MIKMTNNLGIQVHDKQCRYPSIKCEKTSGVRIVFDLLGEPEAEGHDESAFKLSHIDLRADGCAGVLHHVHASNVLLARQDVDLGKEVLRS